MFQADEPERYQMHIRNTFLEMKAGPKASFKMFFLKIWDQKLDSKP